MKPLRGLPWILFCLAFLSGLPALAVDFVLLAVIRTCIGTPVTILP